jgi:uncharacterized protein
MERSLKPHPVPAHAGIGLRLPHHALLLEQRPAAAWLEVHPENYMADEQAAADLELIRSHYPLSLHAVGLSLGSAGGVDAAHVARLRQLVSRFEPALVSDHLSWSTSGGVYLPDLLPLPYTEEALGAVCANVSRVQEALGRQILVENPSTYLRYASASMSEADFLVAVAQRTGCGVLFDVNNVFVSASNQRLDPAAVLAEWCRVLDPGSVGEIHLAGHAVVATEEGTELRIDDHGDRVSDAVWSLYEQALARLGPRPTLIEWDTRLPAFSVLQAEAGRAQARLDECGRADYARAS